MSTKHISSSMKIHLLIDDEKDKIMNMMNKLY